MVAVYDFPAVVPCNCGTQEKILQGLVPRFGWRPFCTAAERQSATLPARKRGQDLLAFCQNSAKRDNARPAGVVTLRTAALTFEMLPELNLQDQSQSYDTIIATRFLFRSTNF